MIIQNQSSDDEEDTVVEKSQLLARLDEMKRAIDGYKELKSRHATSGGKRPAQSKVAPSKNPQGEETVEDNTNCETGMVDTSS